MLQAVDELEVLVVVDNYADTLLPSEPGVIRHPVGEDGRLPSDTLLAEHGLCLLLKARSGDRSGSILLDAGYSPVAAPRNLDRLGERLEDISALVVRHGHEDHVGAAVSLLERLAEPTIVLHPEAFSVPRYWRSDDGTLYRIPALLKRKEMIRRGIRIIESPGPTWVADGLFLVTGEIPRATSFEHGLPGSVKEVNGEFVPDTVIDDQAVVVDVRGHGLVVISGCAHAGIVNSIRYARTLMGMRPLYAAIGGFHLTGEPFRAAIEPTIDALRDENVCRIVPMHCTGVDAVSRMRTSFRGRCAISAVGTRFTFPFSFEGPEG